MPFSVHSSLAENNSHDHTSTEIKGNGRAVRFQSEAKPVKNYILDTNVLLHDPGALTSFAENNVLIPIEVIEEIDRFKREASELGQNARHVSRTLDSLRKLGSLNEGVPLENGGRLRIIFHPFDERESDFPVPNQHHVDSRIVSLALNVQSIEPEVPAILVTKDINLRIKSDALGLHAEDYETGRILLKDLYTGTFDKKVGSRQLDEFRKTGELALAPGERYFPNEFCTLADESSPKKKTCLARVDTSGKKLVAITEQREGVWGIKPRNREQHFAFDALLNDHIKLVTLMGKAGTGKTLMALAAGIQRTLIDREYRRMIVARPTVSMGRELGFLPGSLEEKLDPWMQPIHDALELLGDLNMGHPEYRRSHDLLRSGNIVVEALSYIRGRSIPNQFMIIDEAQNLTPLEAKTIITRVGMGTKIVFTGDPYQIDNPYVDFSSNGFNYIISKFKEQPIAAHLELEKGERSELAELAANLL